MRDSGRRQIARHRAESTPPTRVASLRTRPIERLQQYRARVAGIGAPTRVANRRGKEFFERRVARFAVEARRLRGIDAFRRVLLAGALELVAIVRVSTDARLTLRVGGEGDVGRAGAGHADVAKRGELRVASAKVRGGGFSVDTRRSLVEHSRVGQTVDLHASDVLVGVSRGERVGVGVGVGRAHARGRAARGGGGVVLVVRPAPTLAIRGLVLVRDVSLVVRVGPAERAGGGGGGDGGGEDPATTLLPRPA